MSPKTRTAPAESIGGVREQILEAAMAVLHEEGIRGLSQVQVARAANVRQSHLTYYFPRRCDLIEAVAVRFVDGVVQGIAQTAARSGVGASDPADTLRRVADAISDRGHMRMFIGVITEADGDPDVRAVAQRETRRVHAALAELLGGPDAADRAALTLASFWGLGLYDFVFQLPGRRSAVMRSFLECLQETKRPLGATRKRRRSP